MEKKYSMQMETKKAGVAILISDKIDLKTKTVIQDKERHYITIKGSIQWQDITFVNIYAPDIGTPKYIKQILTNLKGEINSNTITVEEFNTPLILMNRSSRHKVNEETSALNNTLDHIKLIDTYRLFHPKSAEYTFFSSAHGTFSRTYHVSHKTSLKTFKKTEII